MASDGLCWPLIASDCLPHQVHEGQAADAMMIIKHEMEHVWIAKLRLPVAVRRLLGRGTEGSAVCTYAGVGDGGRPRRRPCVDPVRR